MSASPTILVTGAHGQLGCALQSVASEFDGLALHFVGHQQLDITDEQAVARAVAELKPHCVVNCAAYTDVNKAESEPQRVMAINAQGAEVLARVCHAQGSRLLHVSTEYVFDGTAHLPYTETDATNPLSAYGRSKLAGEQAITAHCPEAIIVRVSWLYSEFGKNFVKTMLQVASNHAQVRVVADQIGSSTYAPDLARAIMQIAGLSDWKPGIYHYSNQGVCSWFDLAHEAIALAGSRCEVLPITTAEYPTPAVRPAYSVLSKRKVEAAFGLQIPYWRDSLVRCVQILMNTTKNNIKP